MDARPAGTVAEPSAAESADSIAPGLPSGHAADYASLSGPMSGGLAVAGHAPYPTIGRAPLQVPPPRLL